MRQTRRAVPGSLGEVVPAATNDDRTPPRLRVEEYRQPIDSLPPVARTSCGRRCASSSGTASRPSRTRPSAPSPAGTRTPSATTSAAKTGSSRRSSMRPLTTRACGCTPRAAQHPPGSARIRSTIMASRTLPESPGNRVMWELLPHVLRNEHLRERVADLYELYRNHYLEVFGAGGDPGRQALVRRYATLVIAVLDGLAMQKAIDPERVDLDELFALWADIAAESVRPASGRGGGRDGAARERRGCRGRCTVPPQVPPRLRQHPRAATIGRTMTSEERGTFRQSSIANVSRLQRPGAVGAAMPRRATRSASGDRCVVRGIMPVCTPVSSQPAAAGQRQSRAKEQATSAPAGAEACHADQQGEGGRTHERTRWGSSRESGRPAADSSAGVEGRLGGGRRRGARPDARGLRGGGATSASPSPSASTGAGPKKGGQPPRRARSAARPKTRPTGRRAAPPCRRSP